MNIKKAFVILGVLCSSLLPAGPVRADYLSVSDLQKIAAPIALYPDEIITEIMRASAFPEQIAQAAAWINAHPDFTDQQLEQSWDTFTWDPSVRLLVYSPGILQELYEYPEWTSQLNQAYTAQRQALSRAIQTERHSAWRNRKLKSDDYTEVFQDANGYIAVRARRGGAQEFSSELPAAAAEPSERPEWNNIILGQANHEDADSDSPSQVTTYYNDPGYYFYYDDYERYAVPHDVYGRPLPAPYDSYYPYDGFYPGFYYYNHADFSTKNFNSVNGLATEANAQNANKIIDIRNNGNGGLATAANAQEAAHPKWIDSGTTGLATAANALNARYPRRIDSGTTGLATAANALEARYPKRIDSGTTGLATAANAQEARNPKRIDGGTTGLATAANVQKAGSTTRSINSGAAGRTVSTSQKTGSTRRINSGTARPAVSKAQKTGSTKMIGSKAAGPAAAKAQKTGSTKKIGSKAARPAAAKAQKKSNSKRTVKRNTGAVRSTNTKKAVSRRPSKGASGWAVPVKAKNSGSRASNNQRQNKVINHAQKQVSSRQKSRLKNSQRIGRTSGNRQTGAVIRSANNNARLAAARRSGLRQTSAMQRQTPVLVNTLPAATVHNGRNTPTYTNGAVCAPSGIIFNSENSGQSSRRIVIKDGYPTSPDNDGYPTLNY